MCRNVCSYKQHGGVCKRLWVFVLSVSMCEGVSQSASAKLCLCLRDSVSVKPTGFTASLIRGSAWVSPLENPACGLQFLRVCHLVDDGKRI